VCEQLGESVESLRRCVAGLDPAALDGAEAARLVEVFAEVERLGSAGRTLAAGRVAEEGAWPEGYRDAAAWMSSVAGTTVGKARATLETAQRLEQLPATADALRAGKLSDAQVELVASGATADPTAEQALLTAAGRNGVKGLKTETARVVAAASSDQDQRYAAAKARRYLRHRAISDVEGLLELRGPIDRTARIYAALEPYERDQFEQARKAGQRELPEALAFDAMVQLADDAAAQKFKNAPGRAPATIMIRVDKTAFDRGETVPGETCEIPGVGPIPVTVAQRLSQDAILKTLITGGTDILAISHPGRWIPARLRSAVIEAYPECAHDGCHADRHLEIDHIVPVTQQGPTELANLQRLCPWHHDQKTTAENTRAGPRPPPDP
jgi:hypothetical protein